MNEIIFMLSDTQQQAIQNKVHELISFEVENFRTKLGLHGKYLKKYQLCHYLNLSNNTVDKLIAEGMPYIKVDGVILYEKTLIDKWLQNHSQSS